MSGAIISFFAHKGGDYSREGDHLREAIISNIAYWKSCPKYFVYYAIKSKNFISSKLNIGFFKCSKFSSLINFHGLNLHSSVSVLDEIPVTLDREGIKGREMTRGAGAVRRLLEGGDKSRDGNTVCN